MTSSALMLIVLAQAYTGLALSSVPSVGDGSGTEVRRIAEYDRPLLPNETCVVAGYPGTYDGFHKMHTEATTWQKARQICRDEGGDLAVINGIGESFIMTQVFAESEPHVNSDHPHFAWIGVRTSNRGQEDNWETVRGNTLEQAGFAEWYEPPLMNGCKNCGAVSRAGNLISFGCDEFLGFVCEVPCAKIIPKTSNN